MGGRASRLKGHNWEREVANILNPIAALRQAEVALYKETDEGTIRVDDRAPLAVCKSDRQKATVTMYLDDFLPLIRSIYDK